MPLISVKQEYFDKLETVYNKNPEWMKMQGLDTLDKFVEEIAMFGLTQFSKKGRNIRYLLDRRALGENKALIGTQLHVGIFDPKISPVKNQDHIKPKGGFWTSTYLPGNEFASDWIRWCFYEMPEWIKDEEITLIDVSLKAKIYTIDNYEDLMNLLRDYPFKHPYITKITQTHFAYIDWEKVSENYDGVHLTKKGESVTRIACTRGPCLEWDCESTLWFRNVFTKTEPYEGKLV